MPNTPDEALAAQAQTDAGVGFSRVLHCDVVPERLARQRAKIRSVPASVTLRWPNALGDRPEDALGKHVSLAEGNRRQEFSAEAVEGDKLILRPFP